MSGLFALGSALLGVVDRVLGRLVPDEGERTKIRAELARELMSAEGDLVKAQADIIKAEAGSAHELAAVWRPVLMLVLTAAIANNLIVAPYAAAAFGADIYVPFSPEAWQMISLGVSGYIMGRSGEKMLKIWRAEGGTD